LGLCFVFNVAFGLLYLGPTVAFSAYAASCTVFLNVSYALPVIALLIRGRSVLKEHQVDKNLYNLGKWGLVTNYVAAIFVVVTSIVRARPKQFGNLDMLNMLTTDLFSSSASRLPCL
jgi:choline transport protein